MNTPGLPGTGAESTYIISKICICEIASDKTLISVHGDNYPVMPKKPMHLCPDC